MEIDVAQVLEESAEADEADYGPQQRRRAPPADCEQQKGRPAEGNTDGGVGLDRDAFVQPVGQTGQVRGPADEGDCAADERVTRQRQADQTRPAGGGGDQPFIGFRSGHAISIGDKAYYVENGESRRIPRGYRRADRSGGVWQRASLSLEERSAPTPTGRVALCYARSSVSTTSACWALATSTE